MTVSIIVPVYNALEFARACIASVYRARTDIPFEVIVVDNGSAADVGKWLAEEAARRPNFRVLKFADPLGFPCAVNEGARIAQGDLLVILNSDTLVYDRWLDLLARAMGADDIAAAGPVTNHCGSASQVDAASQELSAAGARDYAARIHDRGTIHEPQRLVFFCTMIRRAVWTALGGLDEGYSPGNFEDDDFCLRARMAGYRLAIARGVFVFHHERKTFDENRLEHGEAMARGQRRFYQRAAEWSRKRGAAPASETVREVTVVVPVAEGWAAGLNDSLTSLANQTVAGFEIVVVSPMELPLNAAGPHTVRHIQRDGNLAMLLNAGIAAAGGRRVAFLPAGDIYFPFHLEVLAESKADAAYTAWTVRCGEDVGAARLDQAAPARFRTGDGAPLVCWMHASPPPFDESLDALCGWDWVMRLRERPDFIPRVTCQKLARPVSKTEASQVADAHPARDAWTQHERRRFLAAIGGEPWERTLILEQNPVERRARQLLASNRLHLNATELESAKRRFEAYAPDSSSDAVISFNIISWTDLVQRPHHFARGLARRGTRTVWVDVRLKAPELARPETFAVEIEPGLLYLELPCAAGDIYRMDWHPAVLETMEAALASLGIRRAVQLVNFPKWTPLVQRLRARFGWPIVYDCLDDQQAFGEMFSGNDAAFETELVAAAAAMITSGRTLSRKWRAHDPVFIGNGADFELFSGARSRGLLDGLPHPIAGFFGAFSGWLDLDWIRESARRFPRWSFVYIGREGFTSAEMRSRWQEATSAPNIRIVGQQSPETLAAYLAQFDICTMPFQNVAITRSMNAVKIFEYLAAGKPVVARDLPETRPLADLGLIDVYDNLESAWEKLELAARAGSREDLVAARRNFAARNTWDQRVEQLIGVLNSVRQAAAAP
jgi:GT2 family glycosyltransferase/glycosyltransferase involved in cell wall biosynthesis